MDRKNSKEIRNDENGAEHRMDGYIGTYYSEKSRGIYRFTFDTESGWITEPELFYEARNAKWVSLNGSSMVFPVEKNGRAGTCFLEIGEGKVRHSEEILEERQTPCYILQEREYVYTANYHEGNVMVYELAQGSPKLVKRIENGEKAGCHQIVIHETCLLVPCLEQNRIRFFDMEQDYKPAGEIIFPAGSGPRHGVFNRDHTKFYVVSEWSNELFIFQVNSREFLLKQTVSVLPEAGDEEAPAAAAAIHITKDNRFLYVSVRGLNLLTVFELNGAGAAAIQHAPCGGSHPRDFVLSDDERFLLAVNRYEGGIICMERDRESGLLKELRQSVPMPEGVALTF